MYFTSTNPNVKVNYTINGQSLSDWPFLFDFSQAFLGFKWVYGIDLFKKLVI